MKTFKQMNEDIQHQKQLNEKGLLTRIGNARRAAVASFKSDPEKHAEKMKNIGNRAKAQDAEVASAKAKLGKDKEKAAQQLSKLKGTSTGYNITKKGSTDDPNSMRPKDKDGNPKHGSFYSAEKKDKVDAAGNTREHTRLAMTHGSDLAASRISARENSLDKEDKDRRSIHGDGPAFERVKTIEKHVGRLKAHAKEAKERIAHAEHTLKLHHDAHKAATAHLETHKEHEFTSSNYSDYHDHHYGSGEQDHHYEEMQKHKDAEQKNPAETHIDNKRLGYDHTHYDHPHYEEPRKADYADEKHGATMKDLGKKATAAHEAYNKMVDSQKKAEDGLPKGEKSKTKFHKKAAYEKVDVATHAAYYKKALRVNPENNEIVKNLKHINKDHRQKEMDI
tara:strand:+ start:2081 stop:3256 length:1176 start_codon:yes stop_codon:yes gene_type:complete